MAADGLDISKYGGSSVFTAASDPQALAHRGKQPQATTASGAGLSEHSEHKGGAASEQGHDAVIPVAAEASRAQQTHPWAVHPDLVKYLPDFLTALKDCLITETRTHPERRISSITNFAKMSILEQVSVVLFYCDPSSEPPRVELPAGQWVLEIITDFIQEHFANDKIAAATVIYFLAPVTGNRILNALQTAEKTPSILQHPLSPKEIAVAQLNASKLTSTQLLTAFSTFVRDVLVEFNAVPLPEGTEPRIHTLNIPRLYERLPFPIIQHTTMDRSGKRIIGYIPDGNELKAIVAATGYVASQNPPITPLKIIDRLLSQHGITLTEQQLVEALAFVNRIHAINKEFPIVVIRSPDENTALLATSEARKKHIVPFSLFVGAIKESSYRKWVMWMFGASAIANLAVNAWFFYKSMTSPDEKQATVKEATFWAFIASLILCFITPLTYSRFQLTHDLTIAASQYRSVTQIPHRGKCRTYTPDWRSPNTWMVVLLLALTTNLATGLLGKKAPGGLLWFDGILRLIETGFSLAMFIFMKWLSFAIRDMFSLEGPMWSSRLAMKLMEAFRVVTCTTRNPWGNDTRPSIEHYSHEEGEIAAEGTTAKGEDESNKGGKVGILTVVSEAGEGEGRGEGESKEAERSGSLTAGLGTDAWTGGADSEGSAAADSVLET